MLDAIVEGKSQDSSERSATLTAPHIPRKIASTHRPDEAEVIARDIKIFFMIKHEAVAIERLWRKMCTVNFCQLSSVKKIINDLNLKLLSSLGKRYLSVVCGYI